MILLNTCYIRENEHNKAFGMLGRIKHLKDSKLIALHKDDPMDYTIQIIMPIVSSSGDCIGSITMVSKDENSLTEADEKILKIASNFLGKQVQ